MSLGKKDIVNNISSETFLNKIVSKALLDSFIFLIKNNQQKVIKISNFGTFHTHVSPMRVGRNPKTKEEFNISARKKLVFRASPKVKNQFN